MTALPCIILVRPQMGENIGAAARAMLNFGLTDLRLVAPRDGWPSAQAGTVSAGALERMPPVQVFASLAEALSDCHYAYATTARRRDMVKPETDAHGAARDAHARSKNGQRPAYVFGPERAGLENDEVALCHAVLTIPVNEEFWSINLAHAVLLTSYEWFRQSSSKQTASAHGGENTPAPHAQLDEFLQRLEKDLEAGQFFRSEGLKPTMVRNIRNVFMRAEPTEQEVRTLHGILTALSAKKNA